MALLVCFREPGSRVNWANKAIYLDQSLYEMLFAHYRRKTGGSPLKKLVSIGCDDEVFFAEPQIKGLLEELLRVAATGDVVHPQVSLLCSVLREAVARRCELAVAGDMHPDLSQR